MAQNNNETNNQNNNSQNRNNQNNQNKNNRNHNKSNHHRNNNNNANNTDNITKFTLGECDVEGKKYEFRYDNGTYSIVLLKEEDEFDVILKTKEKEEAYPEWNKIKRPDKKK